MTSFRLQRKTSLERPIEEVFAFFAAVEKLEVITPPWLHFQILRAPAGALEPGSTIDYRLRVHGIPIAWTTLISSWQPPFSFVDEQLQGPYRAWVHTHSFEERDGRTLVHDQVDYSVPGGRLVHELFVRRDLDRIFDYREARLHELLDPEPQPLATGRIRPSGSDVYPPA